MPLQKMPGRSATDLQTANRRPLQERRRTLQTISELSAAEHIPDFRTSFGQSQSASTSSRESTSGAPKIHNISKRRSLPQYCARPECIETRSLVSSANMITARRIALDREGHASASPPEAGWNARRERARMQAELALSGAHTIHQQPSTSSLQSGGVFSEKTNMLPQPRNKTSRPSLNPYYSQQQHLLHSSRSLTSVSSRPELSSSSRTRSKHSHFREQDVASSERTSTDSSSYRSSRDSTMRRSRSSSSSQSLIQTGVPPLPTGCAQPTRSYMTTVASHYRNGYPIQFPGPMYAKAPMEMRTLSLPYVYVDHSTTPLLSPMSQGGPYKVRDGYFATPQRARPKSLSARTPSNTQQQMRNRQTSRSSSTSQAARYANRQPSIRSLHAGPASTSTRSRSSSLKSPSSVHMAKRTETVTFDQPPAMPNRESLTKWKSEREEAKAEFNFMQRATMKERVRRANEMEQEKEKELQAVGMGAEKGARVLGKGLKSEKRGCFGGVFGRMFGRRGRL